MVKLTLIARVADGLPLAEGLDTDKSHELDQFKQQAKVSRRALSLLHSHANPTLPLEAGSI